MSVDKFVTKIDWFRRMPTGGTAYQRPATPKTTAHGDTVNAHPVDDSGEDPADE